MEKINSQAGGFARYFGKESRTVLNSFFYLSLVQLTNFLLPLIILPFLIRVVGIEKVGIIALVQALMSYFIIIIDYGFNLTATRDIALSNNDREKQSLVVSRVLVLKASLTVVTFGMLVILLITVGKFAINSTAYYWGFLLVLGQVVVPNWFFQGVEKMKYLAYINVIGKTLFAALIFVFVRAPDDYIYVICFLSLGNILSGLIGLWIIFRRFGITFRIPDRNDLRLELYRGGSVMISNLSINAYINSNIFILGIFTNNSIVGYYSVADKILYAVRQVLNLFFQATYPQACTRMLQGHSALVHFFRTHFIPFLGVIVLASAGLCFAAPWLTRFFLHQDNETVVFSLRLLSVVPVIVCCNIPAYQTLLIYHFDHTFIKILVSGAVLNIVLNIILAKYFQITGTIVSIIITELFITLGLHLVLIKRHPQHNLF